jgi:hypothetical protein
MLFDLLGYTFAKGSSDTSKAIEKAVQQTLIMLLGVAIGIVGVLFILGGSKAGQLAASVTEVVATKGASLVK